MSATPPLVATNLVRRYGDRTVVDRVSLSIGAGESVSLMGSSGCGKTTLLHMLGTLDRPDEGQVWIEGRDPATLSDGERSELRRVRLGFVFQQSNLLPALTARENVALPAWRATGRRRESLERADVLLGRFGLTARADARAHVLSLGEAQRVAVARALINRPRLVLADEPTGSLDSEATAAVLDALGEVCGTGAALLVVTHDPGRRRPLRTPARDARRPTAGGREPASARGRRQRFSSFITSPVRESESVWSLLRVRVRGSWRGLACAVTHHDTNTLTLASLEHEHERGLARGHALTTTIAGQSAGKMWSIVKGGASGSVWLHRYFYAPLSFVAGGSSETRPFGELRELDQRHRGKTAPAPPWQRLSASGRRAEIRAEPAVAQGAGCLGARTSTTWCSSSTTAWSIWAAA